ncbi:MAG: methyl-accepting chemotaxis protein [Gammaproteobacteria bacterium]|jgi:methyl-accepting chemotaxis protein
MDGQVNFELTLASGEKINVLATYGEFPTWNWMIITFSDKDQLFSYVYDAMTFSFTVAGAFVLLTFLVVFRFAGGISRSIVELERGAHKLSKNELDVAVNIQGDGEFGSLARSFNLMAAEIRKSHTQLPNSASEEKRLRLELQESDERHKAIVQTATEGFLLIDA